MSDPCALLTGRKAAICRGENVEQATRLAYLQRWVERGEIGADAIEAAEAAPSIPPAPTQIPRGDRQAVPAKPELLTPAQLPCIHRGEYLETVPCVPCRSRGQKGADIYACAIHDRCMMNNFSARDPAKNSTACVTCDERLWSDPPDAFGADQL